MEDVHAGSARLWVRWALIAAAVLCAARLAGYLVVPEQALAGLWRGTALLLGIMLLADDRRSAVAALAGGLTAAMALLLSSGSGVALMLSCLVNVGATSGLAYLLLTRRADRRRLLESGAGVWAFVAAAGASALVPAATAVVTAPAGASWLRPAVQGYGATLLTTLVLTPAVLIVAGLSDPATRRRLGALSLWTTAPPLLLVGAVSMLVFDQPHLPLARLPLTFLVAPTILFATFRLRTLGAVLGVALVGLIAYSATVAGRGPFAAAPMPPADRMLLMQLFLACAFLSALPVATILVERERRAEDSHTLAERFRTVMENVGDVIFQVDREGRWTYLNPAWEALTGRPVAATLGRLLIDAIAAEDRAPLAARLAPVLAGTAEAAHQGGLLETPDGPRWVEMYARRLLDPDGAPAGATGTLRDMDDAKQREERTTLARHHAEERAREAALLAATDELTGLPNRRAFLRQLDREMAASAEFGWPLSVAIFDVDHFKQVNDSHGHGVGDRVLRQVAERAGPVVRGGDLVGRLGGEEFGILMPGASIEDAATVAERLREAIAAPASPGTGLPTVTVSVGLSERVERRSSERILAAADEALYRAKRAGRNRISISA